MNSFEIALKTNELPTKYEDLVPLSFIGDKGVKFYIEKVKLLKDLGIMNEQLDLTLKDGQQAGECQLEILKRIGFASETISISDAQKHSQNPHYNKPRVTSRGHAKANLMGLKNTAQLKNAQAIKNHPGEVQEVIKEAIENDDIPTKTAVLAKIKLKNYMEKHPPKQKKMPDINNAVLDIYNNMNNCYVKLIDIAKYKSNLSGSSKEMLNDSLANLTKIIKEINT